MGKRYDKKHRLLKTGETERADGYYTYRWTSRDGKRHSVTTSTLEELREKEEEIQKDTSDGIWAPPSVLPVPSDVRTCGSL